MTIRILFCEMYYICNLYFFKLNQQVNHYQYFNVRITREKMNADGVKFCIMRLNQIFKYPIKSFDK